MQRPGSGHQCAAQAATARAVAATARAATARAVAAATLAAATLAAATAAAAGPLGPVQLFEVAGRLDGARPDIVELAARLDGGGRHGGDRLAEVFRSRRRAELGGRGRQGLGVRLGGRHRGTPVGRAGRRPVGGADFPRRRPAPLAPIGGPVLRGAAARAPVDLAGGRQALRRPVGRRGDPAQLAGETLANGGGPGQPVARGREAGQARLGHFGGLVQGAEVARHRRHAAAGAELGGAGADRLDVADGGLGGAAGLVGQADAKGDVERLSHRACQSSDRYQTRRRLPQLSSCMSRASAHTATVRCQGQASTRSSGVIDPWAARIA